MQYHDRPRLANLCWGSAGSQVYIQLKVVWLEVSPAQHLLGNQRVHCGLGNDVGQASKQARRLQGCSYALALQQCRGTSKRQMQSEIVNCKQMLVLWCMHSLFFACVLCCGCVNVYCEPVRWCLQSQVVSAAMQTDFELQLTQAAPVFQAPMVITLYW